MELHIDSRNATYHSKPNQTKSDLTIPKQTKFHIDSGSFKRTLHQNMKFTSYVRFDPQILPIFFFFPYDLRGACGSVSGSGACVSERYGWIAARPICAHRKYLPDVQLQIAGCATTDHRMRTLPSRKRCRKPHGGRTEKRKISAISGDQTGHMT